MADALTTRYGALWVQVDGPGTTVELLDCVEGGDLAVPEGEFERIRCWNTDGSGWETVGRKTSPPDDPTFSVSARLFPNQQTKLLNARWPFGLYVMQRDQGRADTFSNYVRGRVLSGVTRVNVTETQQVSFEEENESLVEIEVSADEAILIEELQITKQIGTGTNVTFNAIAFNFNERPPSSPDSQLDKGQKGVIASDSVTAATPKVPTTTNGGTAWSNASADPGSANDDIMSVAQFVIGRSTERYLLAMTAPSGAQGKVFYTDDYGATYSTVNIGGATAGHGAAYAEALCVLDQKHIWLGSAAGYIYFSADGGETWTAQESGTITTGAYNFVHFYDANYGIAGAAADIIAVTTNGGATWSAATAPGNGDDILCGVMLSANKAFVGTDEGKLWKSTDRGSTWTQVTGWTGSGVGDVRAMSWRNEYIGFMAVNNASPVGTVLRTFNGGADWETITTPTNVGLNDIEAISEKEAYIVGNAVSSAGFVAKVTAQG